MTASSRGGMNLAEAAIARTGRIVRKIAVSLGIGALAYFITNMLTDNSATSQILGLVLSVFLGGVTLVAQSLMEFDTRLSAVESHQREHADAIEDQVRGGFSKINEATELFGLVEASALRSAEVIQLVRHSTQIKPTAPTLIFQLARSEIVRTAEFLKELSEGGTAIYEGEDRDWILALARHVESRIDATSLTTVDADRRGQMDSGLWVSDLGQRYLEAQRAAIVERKVRIRRVFIINRPELIDLDSFLDTCRAQWEMGIEVRILDSAQVPPPRRSSLFDFVIFDDAVSYEVTPTSSVGGSRSFVNTRLELRPNRVRDRINRFNGLWESAEELDDYTTNK